MGGTIKIDKKLSLSLKGRFVLFNLVGLIFLTGCANRNKIINYKGESLNWIASYKMVGDDKKHSSYFTLQYKADDVNSIKEVKYLIDGPKGESDVVRVTRTKEFSNKVKFNGGLPSSNNRNIILKLQWSDDTELLLLRPVEE